ncbi:2'-5' RNA ligase family protein [Alloyangia pacifica]|nr:2'-5' RNA ligase family protein [Alloyangia pacifica]
MMKYIIAFAIAPLSAIAQSEIIAIDVLIEPDQAMMEKAEEWNSRLRAELPQGFELDAAHAPHITLLQTFVLRDDMDAILAAVAKVGGQFDIDALTMEATGLYHVPAGEIGLQGIVIEPSQDLHAIQDEVIEAIEPFRKPAVGEEAFVPDPSGAPFDPQLFTYVDSFVAEQSGEKFNPHVTTGVGPIDWVEARETEPFEGFTFGAEGIAVYQLGNYGTAAERLSGK